MAEFHTNSRIRGGYLAGRLRTKWVDTHTDEVYFRDTADGFLTWALALLISVTLLTTAISSIVGGSANVIGSVAGGAATATVSGATNITDVSSTLSDASMQYFTHSLFRTNTASSTGNNPPTPQEMREVAGIFTPDMTTCLLPEDDRQYLAKWVSKNIGLSQNEAKQQVALLFGHLYHYCSVLSSPVYVRPLVVVNNTSSRAVHLLR